MLSCGALEPYRIIRDIAVRNHIIEKAAQIYELPLLRVSELLKAPDDFVDPIHPSAQGHMKIARALQNIMVDSNHANRTNKK